MFVRIARFEGVDPGALDQTLQGISDQIAEGRRRADAGELERLEQEGMGALRRAMVAVDREGGRTASLTFADDEEGMMKVHAWMNSLSPGAGGGRRASVEIYEVAIDEQASA
jgi:hypothetical protein